jgi:hypothetical protein
VPAMGVDELRRLSAKLSLLARLLKAVWPEVTPLTLLVMVALPAGDG